MIKKLNWGCGSIQPKDWMNIDKDVSFYNGIDENFGVTTEGITSDSYDIVVAHASLQQVEWHDLVKQLKELYRVLKPGGVIRISLPDILIGLDALENDNMEWFPNGEDNIHERFCAWLTWYSTSKSLLTSDALSLMLRKAGFIDISEVVYKYSSYFATYPDIISLDTRENEFYFVEAMKTWSK